MSYFDYEMSKRIAAEDYPFYALIMAAMRQADTNNLLRLQEAFPEIWAELKYRFMSPDGIHPMDRPAPEEIFITEEFLKGLGNDE